MEIIFGEDISPNRCPHICEELAEMARVSYFFSMFRILIVPRTLREYSGLYRNIIYISFTFVSICYLFFLTGSNLPLYHSVL